MNNLLKDRKVAILVTNAFEEVELTEPRKALEREGAITEIVSPQKDKVKAWNRKDWGKEYPVDKSLDDANSQDYDALLLPGGVKSSDHLRMDEKAVSFVASFFAHGKPIAAICHGPWILIETGAVKGRTLTSYPSLRTDLKNTGANWVDREVVVNQGLVTSRNPDDIPAFCKKMIEEFCEGVHEEQKTI